VGRERRKGRREEKKKRACGDERGEKKREKGIKEKKRIKSIAWSQRRFLTCPQVTRQKKF
jgi:hypothetical protein